MSTECDLVYSLECLPSIYSSASLLTAASPYINETCFLPNSPQWISIIFVREKENLLSEKKKKLLKQKAHMLKHKSLP